MVLVGPARDDRRSALEVAAGVLQGGGRLLQLRLKGRPRAEVAAAARAIGALAGPLGALVFVNDDAAAAAEAGADGVHVGRDDLTPAAARAVVGPGRLVGRSTHSVAEVERALAAGADYVGVGTVFPSPTKADLAAGGPAVLAAVRPLLEAAGVPGYAIGGIARARVGLVLATGIHGVAVASAIVEAEDVAAETAAFLREIASIVG